MFPGADMAPPSVSFGAIACFLDGDGNAVPVSEADPLPTTTVAAGSPPAGQFVPVTASMPLPSDA